MHLCVFGVSVLPLSTIFSKEFWNCCNSGVFSIFHFIIKIHAIGTLNRYNSTATGSQAAYNTVI